MCVCVWGGGGPNRVLSSYSGEIVQFGPGGGGGGGQFWGVL